MPTIPSAKPSLQRARCMRRAASAARRNTPTYSAARLNSSKAISALSAQMTDESVSPANAASRPPATSVPAYGDGGCSSAPSSVQQYVECVPSPTGSKATGTDKGTRPLPKSIKNKIESQASPQDAQTLENIATKASYGAPETPIK